MGNCVAGGGYLPVLCDKLLMTEGSGLYLAGPALVKSAIGQEVSHEELGGAAMHAQISGTIDYREPNDEACLARLRRLVGSCRARRARSPPAPFVARSRSRAGAARRSDLYDLVEPESARRVRSPRRARLPRRRRQLRRIQGRISARRSSAARPGSAAFRSASSPISIIACSPADGPFQFGGVLYVDSAEKAARFVMNCNQDWLPILFLQDVNGFMVGRDSERAGHHQGRRQAGQRDQQQPRAEADGDHRRLVRRGQLRPVRQGVRSAVHLRLAHGPLRRDGGRAGDRTLLDVMVEEPGTSKGSGRRRRTGGTARQGRRRLRAPDRRPLRRGPRLGRCDYRSGRNARDC